MTRPTWDEICMDLAIAISKRSTCSNPNRQVGCVITNDSHQRVLAWGYNGVASGEDHSCEYIKNTVNNEKTEQGYTCSCVHAEMNAIAKLDSTDPCGKIMYLTLSPCMICARMIVNSGIKIIVIKDMYRDHSPVEVLKNLGVRVLFVAHKK